MYFLYGPLISKYTELMVFDHVCLQTVHYLIQERWLFHWRCFYQLFGLSFWRHPFTAERIHWWASEVVLNFSKSVPMKKQTLAWPSKKKEKTGKVISFYKKKRFIKTLGFYLYYYFFLYIHKCQLYFRVKSELCNLCGSCSSKWHVEHSIIIQERISTINSYLESGFSLRFYIIIIRVFI